MTLPVATLSLDLDNLWSYKKTHGDTGWQGFPSYFNTVIPRFLTLFKEQGIVTTIFVVGQDAALEKNKRMLCSIVEAGHELGNHSFHHEPWLHRYSAEEVAEEILAAERAIEDATGVQTRGFRGPGYSLSETVLQVLADRNYSYDCSTFPTFVGPAARAYYFFRSRLADSEKKKREALFGSMRDGLRPLKPYRWDLGTKALLEIPVTTLPGFRTPIHFSYIHWLADKSEVLANSYFKSSLRLCRAVGTAPSLLLHPLDFMGGDDVEELSFFPGMNQKAGAKVARMRQLLAFLARHYHIQPMGVHAETLKQDALALRLPDFPPMKKDVLSSPVATSDRS